MPCHKMWPMLMNVASRTIHLRITVDDDRLQGHIRGGDEPATPFEGWLGLITNLDRLIDEPSPYRETPPHGETSPDRGTPSAHRQAAGGPMLFHITQVHTPEMCPLGSGGSGSLYDADVDGVTMIGRYGANAQHTLFFVVEADDANAVHRFLKPGFRRCTSTITPVSEVSVPKT